MELKVRLIRWLDMMTFRISPKPNISIIKEKKYITHIPKYIYNIVKLTTKKRAEMERRIQQYF